MQLGDWQLDTVSGGDFRLDGGAMFGVVPKPVWQRRIPADDLNRIAMTTNCVLARDGTHTLLIDTGYGGKLSDREREQYAVPTGDPLLENLAKIGVAPESITHVLLSHLHFDHAGGASRKLADGRIEAAFPKARFLAGRIEWELATGGAPELRGAYPMENLLPLEQSGHMTLLEDGAEPLPGIWVNLTGGHTPGHFAVTIRSRGETAVYLGDLCPSTAHLRQLWCMSYDLNLRETRIQKPRWLGRAADEGWWICWDHDPAVAASRLQRDDKAEFVPVDARAAL